MSALTAQTLISVTATEMLPEEFCRAGGWHPTSTWAEKMRKSTCTVKAASCCFFILFSLLISTLLSKASFLLEYWESMHWSSPGHEEFRALQFNSLHQLQYPMDRTVCWRHWLLCPVCKCCKKITLLEERFSWEKYLVCADCQKLLPTCLAFFEVLITMARCQFSQNHRKVVTDTRIWPWADLLK